MPFALPLQILIVRVSSLGDVVHNMPMLADLHRHYPQAQIDWVVEEGYTSLVRLNRGVRTVLPFALRRWRKSLLAPDKRAQTWAEMRAFRQALRATRYDLVFDTQGLFKTALVMRMARLAPGGRRIGLANATEGSGYEAISRVFHTTSVPVGLRTHAVLRARSVAAGALGYQVEGVADFGLQAPLAGDASVDTAADSAADTSGTISGAVPNWLPNHPYAVFFHGTARAAKQWAPANWIEVGRLLAARAMPVLLPWGSAAERLAAQQLAANIPGAVVLPQLPMMDAVLLAQRAALVIGLDSGLTHIAAAYGRPTVELYCDSPRWKTEGNWSPAIINLGDTGTPPTVGEVAAAVERLLGSHQSVPRTA